MGWDFTTSISRDAVRARFGKMGYVEETAFARSLDSAAGDMAWTVPVTNGDPRLGLAFQENFMALISAYGEGKWNLITDTTGDDLARPRRRLIDEFCRTRARAIGDMHR